MYVTFVCLTMLEDIYILEDFILWFNYCINIKYNGNSIINLKMSKIRDFLVIY